MAGKAVRGMDRTVEERFSLVRFGMAGKTVIVSKTRPAHRRSTMKSRALLGVSARDWAHGAIWAMVVWACIIIAHWLPDALTSWLFGT